MGMRATLTLIAKEAFKDEQPSAPEGAPQFDIDKTWGPLHDFFRDQAKPLKYAIQGNRRPYGSLKGSGGLYAAYVTPLVTRRIAQALEAVSWDQVLEGLQQQRRSLRPEDWEYYRWGYQQLKEAYALAALQGAGLWIIMC
jgi:Domain of unknown function (DUF1877)